MNKIKTFGPLFVIIAALLWSFDGLLRTSLYSLPPTVVVFYEHLLGAAVLLVLVTKWLPDVKKFTRKQWISIITVALFSGALGTILYTAALGMVNYTQYSVVVLLQQLQPIWAIGAAAIILKEKVTPKFIWWAFLALVAAYFISFKDLTVNFQTGAGTVTAALMALGAGFCWGTSTAFSKYSLNKVSFLTTTALRFFLTPLIILPFIMFGSQANSLTALTAQQWQSLLLIVFSTGLVALGFYYYGLKKTPARITTLCELVWPASAILIDYFYFHKTLSMSQLFGIALLALCLYKVTKSKEVSKVSEVSEVSKATKGAKTISKKYATVKA